MSNIGFTFSKESTNDSMKIAIYKDDLLKEDILEVNEVQPDSNPLLVSVTDGYLNEDDDASTHTLKLRLEAVAKTDDEAGFEQNVTALFNQIQIDGCICDESNDFLKEHVKVYNRLTDAAASGIVEGSITSESTGTYDLGLGDGSQVYYVTGPWANAGWMTEESILVLTYEGNFTTWFAGLGYFE